MTFILFVKYSKDSMRFEPFYKVEKSLLNNNFELWKNHFNLNLFD
jgi:hypothetical protein